jgi:hypothetical protein
MLLLGDIGQQVDIHDVEADLDQLRATVRSQRSTDRSQDEALLTLRREVTDLKLIVAELARLLVASGTIPASVVERLANGIDQDAAPR